MKNGIVYVTLNSKGGVGKSLTTNHVLTACMTKLDKQFMIYEVDNNNFSHVFEKSNILKKEVYKNFSTQDGKQVSTEIIIKTMMEQETNILVDAGGGDDSWVTLASLKNIGDDVAVKYLIPINRNLAQLSNAVDTFKRVNDPANTIFILNGYTDINRIEDEFVFYFGDKRKGIKSVKEELGIELELKIPYRKDFEIAESKKYTIYDLAQISEQVTLPQLKKTLLEKYGKLKPEETAQRISKIIEEYMLSQDASEVLKEVYANFLPFLEK